MVKRNFFVEIGRVAQVNFGPDAGKLVVILDIVDSNRVLADGPNFTRATLPIRWISLTKIKIRVARSSKTSTLLKAFNAAKVQEQFDATSWGKKALQTKKRANTTDFDRFKCMLLRKQKSKVIGQEVHKLLAPVRAKSTAAQTAAKKN